MFSSNSDKQPKVSRIRVSVGLFLLLLFCMPFYDGSCGHDFAVGFPLYLVSVEQGDPTVWQPIQTGDLLKDIGIIAGINFGVMILLWILLKFWFRSQIFQRRIKKFRLSNFLCLSYTLYFFIVGYLFILFTLVPIELNPLLEDILSRIYILPLLYLGGTLVLPISQQFGEFTPLALMPIALPVALFNMYWLAFILNLLIVWVKNKFSRG